MAISETSADPAWRFERRPLGLGDLAALLVWTAAIAFFFWDAVSLQNALFYFDITEINFPYRHFLAEEIRLGRFSRWCPGLYCGMPLFSESQAGYLHPLKYLLYPWMATWKAFNLDTILSVWLTGVGTYGWLRRHVGPPGALTGAAIFGLSGYAWAHLIHTSMINALASVPLVVWAAEWAWDRGRPAAIVLGAVALACEVFAGHLQDTVFTIAMLGLYTVYRAAIAQGRPRRLAILGSAAGIVAIGLAISAVQWIPSKELLDRSPRSEGLSWGDLTYGSWNPELLPALVVREAYGTRARNTDWMDGFYPYHEMNTYVGLTALALAMLGAAAYRDRWVAFWVILAAIGSVLMLGRFTFLFDHAHRIPIVGSSRIPVRFHVWVSLALAALAGVGVDRLERGFPVRLRSAGTVVATMLIASVPILLYVYSPVILANQGNTMDPRKPSSIAVSMAGARAAPSPWVERLIVGLAGALAIVKAARYRSSSLRRLACWALPVVVIADLFGAHWVEVPTISPSYWTSPPQSARILNADPTFVRLAFVRHWNEPAAGEPGYASMPIDVGAARDSLGWSLPIVWGLSSLGGETPIIARRMIEFTDQVAIGLGLYDVASVTHLIANRRNPLGLPHPVPAGVSFVYRNPNPLPRARLMGRPAYPRTEREAIATIKTLGASIRDRIVVEDPDRPLPEDAVASGSSRIIHDEPDRVDIETESTSPSYLVLADTFDPGWSATVDGVGRPIRPAWLRFRAVYLPTGKHKVVFRYRPAGFELGLGFTVLGLIASAVAPRSGRDGSDRRRFRRRPARIAVALASLDDSDDCCDCRGFRRRRRRSGTARA